VLESLTADHDDALHLAPKIAELRKQPTVANVLALYSRVSNSSKLSNDPDLDAHYTVALVMESAPNLAVAAAQLKVARARGLHEAVVKAARTATAVNPALASDLSTKELNEAYERFVDFVDAPRYAPEQIEAATVRGASSAARHWIWRRARRMHSTGCSQRASTVSNRGAISWSA
jgi:lipopolysaccharide biosynthesis regulator YciM